MQEIVFSRIASLVQFVGNLFPDGVEDVYKRQEIHIGNRVADVELLGKDGNKVRLDIDGQPYEVDIVMAENGACSILHDGHSYNCLLYTSIFRGT